MNLAEMLDFSIKHYSSDLHLSAGLPPFMRIDGDIHPINAKALEQAEISKIITELLNDKQRQEYKDQLELDFSFEIAGLARVRANVFTQARGAAAVFRLIPDQILTLDDLGFPPIIKDIANFPQGLVLVTGPTGSGKSTTLAAIVDYINTTDNKHILTIEDPIEFVHSSKKCLINQREVFRDTHNFQTALRSALREDPDIILVGELRDLATLRMALTAAETGHLVLGTLHTNSAPKTINRIVDAFPGAEKSLVRSILSESLQAVIAQHLVKKQGGGRIAALEIMLSTPAIRHLIREDKMAQMYSAIQMGQANGMQTLDQHLMLLMAKNLISQETAREIALHKALF